MTGKISAAELLTVDLSSVSMFFPCRVMHQNLHFGFQKCMKAVPVVVNDKIGQGSYPQRGSYIVAEILSWIFVFVLIHISGG